MYNSKKQAIWLIIAVVISGCTSEHFEIGNRSQNLSTPSNCQVKYKKTKAHLTRDERRYIKALNQQ